MLKNEEKSKISGIICEENKQEREFANLVQAWVDDKISYETLMFNYPSHNEAIFKRGLKWLIRNF